jgi:hypothetical protein
MKFHIKKQDDKDELLGVKSALKKSNGLVNYLKREMDTRHQYVLNMMIANDLYSQILSYYIDNKIQYKFVRQSYIAEYTNKKGFTSKAHFSPSSDKYIGSVRSLGTDPILVDCYEIPNREKHEWCSSTNKIVDTGKKS